MCTSRRGRQISLSSHFYHALHPVQRKCNWLLTMIYICPQCFQSFLQHPYQRGTRSFRPQWPQLYFKPEVWNGPAFMQLTAWWWLSLHVSQHWTKIFIVDKKVARDKTLTELATGNVASTNANRSNRPASKDPSVIFCFNCGEPGHKSPVCPKGKGGETKENKIKTSANIVRNNNNRTNKPRPRKKDSAQPAIVLFCPRCEPTLTYFNRIIWNTSTWHSNQTQKTRKSDRGVP